MARSSGVKLSILSTYDSKGTDQGEKALQKFAKQFGEVDKATKQVKLDPVAEQFARQSIQADQAAAKLQGYSTKMTSVGKSLSLSVTAPIAAAGAAAFKLSTDFENAMNKVSTIADTSDVPMDTLRKSILKLSDDTGIAASDIADNVYNAISAGQKTGDAVAFVGNAAKLAKAGFTDSASALDVLTTTLNAYKLEADQASHVSDVLLQTQNKGKTTVGELSSSIGKAIPTAAAFNVNLENLAAAYATTTANGVATAESTTYIKSMLKELGDTGSTVGQIIQQKTGKSFSDLMASGGTLGDALNALNEEGSKSNKTMYDMFGSAEAASAAAILASDNSSKFTENLSAMDSAAGLTDESFGKMASTTGSMNKAFNRIKNSALEFGDAIVADAQPILDGFTGTVKSITGGFGSLDQGQRQAIVGAAAFAASLGPVTIAGGKVVGVASKVVKGYAELKAAQAAVTAGEMANGDALTRKTKILGTTGNALQKYVTKANLAKAGAAGLAVVIAGVAIKAYMDYREQQEKVTKATEALRSAQQNAANSAGAAAKTFQESNSAMSSSASAVSVSANAYKNVRTQISDLIEKQAELTDSLQDTFSEAYTNVSMLDGYGATIEELANKSNLTSEEQARLKTAVEGFNEVAGTSYSVVDALNGKIADENGKVIETTSAFKELIAQKKIEMQIEALRSGYTETYKAQAEAMKALTDAKKHQADMEVKLQEAIENGGAGYEYYYDEVEKAKNAVNDAQGVYDAAADTCQSYEDQISDLTAAQNAGSKSVQSYVAANSKVALTLQSNGRSTGDFAKALEDLGLTFDDVNAMGSEAMEQLANDFDGDLDSIVKSCSKSGTKIPKEFADKITAGRSKVNKAAGDMSAGAANAAAQKANGQPAGEKLSSTTASGIGKLAYQPLSSAGSMISNAVNAAFNGANGSEAGSRLSSTTAGGINTTAANANAAALGKNAYNSASGKMNGKPIGANFSKGLANGIAAEAWRAGQAAVGVASNVVNAVIKRWDQHSPSKVAQGIGENWSKGLAVGEEGAGYIAVQRAVDVADEVISATSTKLESYRPNVSIAASATGAYIDSQSNTSVNSSFSARIDQLDDTMKDVLATLKQIKTCLPAYIRDNAPVVIMTEQQAARYAQKLVTMNV